MLVPFKEGKEVEWIELNVLCTGQPLSKANLLTASDKREEDVEDWLAELDSRINAMGPAIAPYEINQGRVTARKRWTDVPEYLLCAHYSYHGVKDRSNGPKLFERISGTAIGRFMAGQHIVSGSPSQAGFNQQLDRIAEACHEARGQKAGAKFKDDRVDVFAYKLFGDKRSSNLCLLMQCAAGTHWREKKEINLRRWTKYIGWYDNHLVLSLSTTDVIPSDEWNQQTSEYGLLLDRLRIYRSLYASNEVDSTLRKDVLKWCKSHSVVKA